jgi:hypothetical protein
MAIEDETKARDFSLHERLAASEMKSDSPLVTRGSYLEFPIPHDIVFLEEWGK